MRQFYPRSFLRLILLGNVVVAFPLLVAIVYVAVDIENLAVQNEKLTQQASTVAQLNYELPEDLEAMERVLRQYRVLADRSLLDDYEVMHREWENDMRLYADVPMLASLAGRIETVAATARLDAATLRSAKAEALRMQGVLAEVTVRTRELVSEAERIAARELENFRHEAMEMRDRLLVALACGLVFAALFLAFGRRLLTRLLRDFESAVIALGRGKLDREIRLNGPEDMRKVGRRLDWLRRRLLELEQQRVLVLRHVSHELKTPLAALREGASLLTEGAAGPLTPAQSRIVGIMRNNALRLHRLIDSLLKLQQVGYAGDHIRFVPLRFDELIQQVLTTHQLAARSKRLRFSGSLAPLVVSGGREELTTVVDNLISNAVKYSPEDGVVTLSLVEDAGSAVFDVIDRGPGVPASERQRIFEPFYRSSSNAKDVAGVGLGLAIAREFALAHQGSLELVDEAEGSHFRVVLPLGGDSA